MVVGMSHAILLLVGSEIVIMDLGVSLELFVRGLGSRRLYLFRIDCIQTSSRSYHVSGGACQN